MGKLRLNNQLNWFIGFKNYLQIFSKHHHNPLKRWARFKILSGGVKIGRSAMTEWLMAWVLKQTPLEISQGEAFPKGATTQCHLRFWVVHLRKQNKLFHFLIPEKHLKACRAKRSEHVFSEVTAIGCSWATQTYCSWDQYLSRHIQTYFLNRQKCTCPLKVWSPSANGNVKNKSIGNRQPLALCHWNWKAKSSCQIVVLYYCCSAEHDDHFSVKCLSFECKKQFSSEWAYF